MASTLQDNLPTPSRTGEIESTLKHEILGGQYRPGERLPSERDLAARFETSRGTVREAVKKLEQLGIVSIQPGGARVLPVQNATLDVLGALLKLHTPPDPLLADQVMEVFGTLMHLAAISAIDKASDEQIKQAITAVQELMEADIHEQHPAMHHLAITFIEASGHLVLQLVMNGMRSQFIENPWPNHPPVLDRQQLVKICKALQAGLKKRDGDKVSTAMHGLHSLLRASVKETFVPTDAKPGKKL